MNLAPLSASVSASTRCNGEPQRASRSRRLTVPSDSAPAGSRDRRHVESGRSLRSGTNRLATLARIRFVARRAVLSSGPPILEVRILRSPFQKPVFLDIDRQGPAGSSAEWTGSDRGARLMTNLSAGSFEL